MDGEYKVKLSNAAEWRGRLCGVGIGIILFLIAQVAAHWIFPPSLWLAFNGIHIDNIYNGECPDMQIDRTIRRQFRGVYSFSLVRMEGTGEGTLKQVIVSISGERDYEPSEQTPFIISTTNQFVNSICPLPPGSYYVRGSVRPLSPVIDPAAATADSNIFEVYDQVRPEDLPRREGSG